MHLTVSILMLCYFEINEWHTLSCSSNCVGLYLISVCDKEASAWTPNYENVICRQTVSSYLYPYFQYYIRMRIPYPSTRVEGICGVVQYSNGRLHLHIVHALTSCRYWSMMCISSSIIMNCNCNTKEWIQYRGRRSIVIARLMIYTIRYATRMMVFVRWWW